MEGHKTRKRFIGIACAVLALVLILVFIFPNARGPAYAYIASAPAFAPYTVGSEVARVDFGEIIWDAYSRGE
ncbi:MAG: hypothetical protein FWG38_00145, partial [Defluviitaleaceae bacterium]|nr:hypothetical protein [Defluviitaleaceae bacterium]